jgi:hypothetical protein
MNCGLPLVDVVGRCGPFAGGITEYIFGGILILVPVSYYLDLVWNMLPWWIQLSLERVCQRREGYGLEHPYDGGWSEMSLVSRISYPTFALASLLLAPFWFSVVAVVLFLSPWILFFLLLIALLALTFLFWAWDCFWEWRGKVESEREQCRLQEEFPYGQD